MSSVFPIMNEMKSSNTQIVFLNAHNYKYERRKLFKLYKLNGQYVAMVKDEALFNDMIFIHDVKLASDNGYGHSYAYQLKDVVKVNGYILFYFS